jgi:TonB family protein
MIGGRTLLVVVLAFFVGGLDPLPAARQDDQRPARYDEETMSEARLVHKVAPRYPEDAKKEGVQETVVLDAVIAEDGRVRETRLQEGEDPRLVGAARAAVGQWRFEPVRDENGDPIEVLFAVTIRFALH